MARQVQDHLATVSDTLVLAPSSIRPVRQVCHPIIPSHGGCRLFSTLWLIANDISIGYSTSSLLCHNTRPLSARICQSLEVYAVDVPIRLLRWMNSYPAGLKLNDELGRAFCESSVQAIELWWHRGFCPLPMHTSVDNRSR